ncbi:MAG TPA: hypothetical protein VJU15_10765, partial [Gemmatimonadales bacterium]|nr:hypothetical protein [Gemmatimonadales bacterium]
MKRTSELLPLIGIVAAGFAVRLSHALASGLWRDEALAVDIALLPSLRDVTDFLVHHESHPPLYYLLLRGWIMIAGAS